ncbi:MULTISPECIES: hydroxyacid dehydrogenase [Bacillaceae]|uniref:hydroxyacid dehydrogenase n=1 Tax=Bacillaceae TaxID=186817 RepID=UPI000E73294D|nr:hydroxyacid dehydrogenase [Bacillus sp. PK3_68]RJS60297.1 3-phosphoglycerate dehydrogenase [Bacillus sp. PK3_68]
MSYLVYIPQDIEEAGKNYLLERGYKLRIGSNLSQQTLEEEIKDCDALLTRSIAIINKEVIQSGKKLKVIAKYGVGLDNIDVKTATERGIYVTNTPEANANTVAEHVMAFILTLSKQLLSADKELRTGNYGVRHLLSSMDLEGKTLGIIGLGRIGKLLAQKAAKGFGMKVIGYDPYLAASTSSDLDIVTDLEWVFRNADVISLHLPLSETTKETIGSREFSWMKPSAYFVNASRGGIVREKDLIEALTTGKIAGAGIDVFEIEPPDRDNPLFQLENVIVSPHSAALTKEASVRMAVHAAMQVDQVLRGERPDWAVNDLLNKEISI